MSIKNIINDIKEYLDFYLIALIIFLIFMIIGYYVSSTDKLNQNYQSIHFFKFQTCRVQSKAILINIDAYKYIDDPCYKVQTFLLKQDLENIYILGKLKTKTAVWLENNHRDVLQEWLDNKDVR